MSQYVFGQWQDIALGVGIGLVIVLILMVIAWAMEKNDERDKREASRIMREHFQMSIDNARAREQEKENEMDFPQLTLGIEQINEAISEYLWKRGLRIRDDEEIRWDEVSDETNFYVTVPAELISGIRGVGQEANA